MASRHGFTLLETALALSVATVFLTVFFLGYQSYLRSVTLVTDGMRGPGEAAELLDRMVRELDQATVLYSATSNSFTIDFQVPAPIGRVAYQLVPSPDSTDPLDAQLRRYSGGDSTAGVLGGNGSTYTLVGPRHMIANFNPFKTALVDAENGAVSPTASASLFHYPLPSNPGPNSTPRILMELVIQPKQDSPIRYVRAASTPRIFQ